MVLVAPVQVGTVAADIALFVGDRVGPGGELLDVLRGGDVVDLAALRQDHEGDGRRRRDLGDGVVLFLFLGFLHADGFAVVRVERHFASLLPSGETDRRLGDLDFLRSLQQIEPIAQAVAICDGAVREGVDQAVRLLCDVLPDGVRVERVVRHFQVERGTGRTVGRVQGNEDLRDLRVGVEGAGRGDPGDGAAEGDVPDSRSTGAVGSGDLQDVGPRGQPDPDGRQVGGVLGAGRGRVGAKGDRFGTVGQGFRHGQGLGGGLGVGDGVFVGEGVGLRAHVLVGTADHGRGVVGNGLSGTGAIWQSPAGTSGNRGLFLS